jgi:hypothetical protein
MYNGYIGDPTVNFNRNNPFLEMIAALDDAGGQEQQVQAGPPAENIVGRFKLPEFWPHAPGIWFARAELRFEVGGGGSLLPSTRCLTKRCAWWLILWSRRRWTSPTLC